MRSNSERLSDAAVEAQHKSGLQLAADARGERPHTFTAASKEQSSLQMFRQPREAPETSASSSISSSTHSSAPSEVAAVFAPEVKTHLTGKEKGKFSSWL